MTRTIFLIKLDNSLNNKLIQFYGNGNINLFQNDEPIKAWEHVWKDYSENDTSFHVIKERLLKNEFRQVENYVGFALTQCDYTFVLEFNRNILTDVILLSRIEIE